MHDRMIRVGVLSLLQSASAIAQDRSEIVRAELVAQVQPAVNAREWARVVELTSRAGELRWSPSLRMWSAVAHEQLGHPLEALGAATRCANEALADARLNNRGEILERCNLVAERMQRRVGRVVVNVPSPAPPGLQVSVQGSALTPALWGVEYPVLPGSVRVEARSSAGATFETRVDVPAGELRGVRVVLVTPPNTHGGGEAPIEAAGPGVGPWAVVGAGGALLTGAAVFYGLRSLALQGVTDEGCSYGSDGWSCPRGETDARDHYDRARVFEVTSGVMLGVGAAAVVGGLVWYFVARRPGPERRHALRWDVTPAAGGVWLTLGGEL